jgi:hypothetical protein
MVLTSLGRVPAVLVLSSGCRTHGLFIDRLAVVLDDEAIASAPVFSSTRRAGSVRDLHEPHPESVASRLQRGAVAAGGIECGARQAGT